MQRVIDRLGGSHAVAICISTLLLLMNILAQARLFFGRELLGIHLGCRADDVLDATLRVVLLATMHGRSRGRTLDVLISLVDATA